MKKLKVIIILEIIYCVSVLISILPRASYGPELISEPVGKFFQLLLLPNLIATSIGLICSLVAYFKSNEEWWNDSCRLWIIGAFLGILFVFPFIFSLIIAYLMDSKLDKEAKNIEIEENIKD